MTFSTTLEYNPSFNIHQVAGRIGNITLVEYPDKLLLIDTGSKKDYKRLESFIVNDLGRTMDDIRLIAVSHGHPDHSAGTFALRKKYGCVIAGHPDIDKWYRGFGGRAQQAADVIFSHITATQSGVPARRFWFRRTVRPDYTLSDGDALPGFKDWTALHTPGHTTNDIVFYHSSSQTLYIADLIVKMNETYHLPYSLPRPDLMEASLKKISALKVKTLILPHGGINVITDINTVTQPLFSEIYRRMPFPIGLLRPFTKLSPEIKKAHR